MKIEPGSSCELSMLRKKVRDVQFVLFIFIYFTLQAELIACQLLGMSDIFVLLHYGTLLGHLEIIIAPPMDARYRFN